MITLTSRPSRSPMRSASAMGDDCGQAGGVDRERKPALFIRRFQPCPTLTAHPWVDHGTIARDGPLKKQRQGRASLIIDPLRQREEAGRGLARILETLRRRPAVGPVGPLAVKRVTAWTVRQKR